MDLSAAYGAEFVAASSAPTQDETPTDTQQQPAIIVPEPLHQIAPAVGSTKHPSSNRSGDACT